MPFKPHHHHHHYSLISSRRKSWTKLQGRLRYRWPLITVINETERLNHHTMIFRQSPMWILTALAKSQSSYTGPTWPPSNKLNYFTETKRVRYLLGRKHGSRKRQSTTSKGLNCSAWAINVKYSRTARFYFKEKHVDSHSNYSPRNMTRHLREIQSGQSGNRYWFASQLSIINSDWPRSDNSVSIALHGNA